MRMFIHMIVSFLIIFNLQELYSLQYSGYSEIVNIPTMGPFNSQNVPSQTNCPHSGNLTPLTTPSDGTNIIISTGINSIIKNSTLYGFNGIVNRITIQSGASLTFDDSDLTLNVREIVVNDGGSLIAGSLNCRILRNINIVFHGSNSTSSLSDPASSSLITDSTKPSKGLLVYGSVSMHGKYLYPSWTRLASTAAAGSYVIQLQDPVNWEQGQSVLLTTTVYLDCPDEWKDSDCGGSKHQNEVKVIGSVSGSTVTLTTALAYSHFAGIEYQGEVALLSRNIVLRGSDSGDGFGGHTKVIGEKATGQFSSVQADNMGQFNILGRYPFHLHMMYNSTGASASYFQDNSVTNSNFRCYTVHGTNNTRVSRNVAYNVKGMCYYFEDGVEENTVVEYNLAAHVSPMYRPANGDGGQYGETFDSKTTGLVLPADTSASGFYFLNAYNTIYGNAASGGWSGFAFPNAPQRMGNFRNTLPSSGSTVNPLNRPLLKFYGNTAHSAGHYWWIHGSCIYVGAWLTYDEDGTMTYLSGRSQRTVYNGTVVSYHLMENNKVFLCNKGIAHWGNNVQIDRAEMHDVIVSAMMFGSSAMHNTLVNMRSSNPNGILSPIYYYRMGFQFYDTWIQTILSNVTFRHFTEADPNTCAIRYMDFSDQYTNQGINAVRNLRFESVNMSKRVCLYNCGPSCYHEQWVESNPSISAQTYTVWDYDGSLLNTGEPTIVASHSDWWQTDDNRCTFRSSNNIWTCPWTFRPWNINPKSTSSDITVVYTDLFVPGLTTHWGTPCDNVKFPGCSAQFFPKVARISKWGKPTNQQFIDLKASLGGVSGLSNMGWYWRVRAANYSIDGAPSNFYIDLTQIPRETYIVLAVAYPPTTKFIVNVNLYTNYIFPMSSKEIVFAKTEKLNPTSQFQCRDAVSNYDYYGWPCNNTGGSGLSWHFDGKHFYLRLVNYGCYTIAFKDTCDDNYTAYGARINKMQPQIKINITAICDGCPVQNRLGDVVYYDVEDVPPTQPLNTFMPTATPTIAPSTVKPNQIPSTKIPTTPILNTLLPTNTKIPTVPTLSTFIPTATPTIAPTTVKPNQDSNSEKSFVKSLSVTVIGAVAGGVGLLLLLIIGTIIYCYCYSQTNHENDKSRPDSMFQYDNPISSYS